MRHKHLISVIGVIVLVSLTAATVGCAADEERKVVDMMRKTPGNATFFSFQDVKAMRNDHNLEVLYRDYRNNSESTFGDYGVDLNDVNHTVSSISFDVEDAGALLILDGDFDLGEVRDRLNSLGFDKDEYRGVEVWKRDRGVEVGERNGAVEVWKGGELVALRDNLVIAGDKHIVRYCIEVIKGEKDSLWDNEDARDVVNRLPDGIMLAYFAPFGDGLYSGVGASGGSMEKKDEETLKSTQVFMFEDENAARSFAEERRDVIGARTVEKDGRFVILTSETAITRVRISNEATP